MENISKDFSTNFTAKKSLGQNFIHAPQAIGAMVKSAFVDKNSLVIEVGPGKGALTGKLLETGARVRAVEKDERAIEFLKGKFSKEIESGQLYLINQDILEFVPPEKKYTLVGNIPYYITGELIRKFLEIDRQPEKMVLMVQKEVAKRIVDEKGSILSMSVKAYGDPKYVLSVPRKFFRPIPNVDSAIISIENISKSLFLDTKISEKDFFEILKAGFAHKRKLLIRNLEEKIPKNILNDLWVKEGWSKDLRAENLSLEMWKKIVGYSKKP